MKCRLCEVGSIDLHFDFGRQPVVHALLTTPKQPYRSFPFKVGYCPTCGFMQLIDIIPPEDLYKNYFTVSSWKSQPHVPRLIELMEAFFDIDSTARILEIGCNDGVFMEKLSQRGFSNVIGIEPTLDAYNLAVSRGLTVINGFFGRSISDSIKATFQPNLVIARQVIEHIRDLHEFLNCVYDVLPSGGGLLLELPDHSMNYEFLDYSFWEEHCNYFTYSTLSFLLSTHGFDVLHHEATLFSGKALFVYAQKSSERNRRSFPKNVDHEAAMRFKHLLPVLQKSICELLERNASRGIAVYGAGARSSNFINLLGLQQYIDVFIDDQPEKQQNYVPGCERLIRSYVDDDSSRFFLLGVNCENECKLVRRRGLANFVSILPPSKNLPEFWRILALSKNYC